MGEITDDTPDHKALPSPLDQVTGKNVIFSVAVAGTLAAHESGVLPDAQKVVQPAQEIALAVGHEHPHDEPYELVPMREPLVAVSSAAGTTPFFGFVHTNPPVRRSTRPYSYFFAPPFPVEEEKPFVGRVDALPSTNAEPNRGLVSGSTFTLS
jgi:hypothetical protein